MKRKEIHKLMYLTELAEQLKTAGETDTANAVLQHIHNTVKTHFKSESDNG